MQPQAKYRADYQAPSYTIKHIDLEFDLDPKQTRVKAISQLECLREGEPLLLDGEHLKLLDVQVDGKPYDEYSFNEQGQLVLQHLPQAFSLSITTEISPETNKAFSGLYLSGQAYCTQCEAEGFRRITYFLDRPDVLATFTTLVRAPKTVPFLLSNGNKEAAGELDENRHFVQWRDPIPKPCYLFALVAGDFDLLEDRYTTRSGREVALQLFVDRGNLDRGEHAMTSLINAMRWEEERFNLEYDLDIYMVVAVDFFNMGAMENKGLNIFNSKFVLANKKTATDDDFLGIEAVIGHEYFHNWTGNRITCRDWFQLSLKEGLTVFRDQEFSSDLGSRSVNRIKNVRIMRSHQFAEDAGPMAHPIRPDKVIEMNNFYTLTVYEKGSEVIRMLHTLLGEENFQKGMQLYVARHDGQAVTCDDFVNAMSDASGVDLTHFKRWYSQSGTPVVNVESTFSEGCFRLTLTQHTPATADQSEKHALHIPVAIELLSKDGQSLDISARYPSQVLDLREPSQTWEFDGLSDAPIAVLFEDFSAPVKVRIDYSEAQLITIIRHARNDFARWDAMQSLIKTSIANAVTCIQAGEAHVFSAGLVSLWQSLVAERELDAAFKAELLTLPSEGELAEHFELVDVDAIAQARDSLIAQFATALKHEFAALEQECASKDGQTLSHEDMGYRALRRVALMFVAFNDGERVAHVYQQAELMTDKLAALAAANGANIAQRDNLFSDYERTWQHDGLIMDKWFALQASNTQDNALERVKALLTHSSFSMDNPNRVRSLVGSFGSANARHFHAIDGSGYVFLTDVLIELNGSNPQVASRLITPLIQTAKLDSARKKLIVAQLQRLQALENLSKDLFEKVDKALELLS